MSLEPAEVIQGKYRIVRLIGEGGMGAVYEGENIRINRRVAIKVLHAGFASNTDVVRRFEREAQAAGRIGNDHILEVLDLGELPNGDYFMVMEFLDGEPLSSRIKARGRVTPQELAPIMRNVCDGLAAAHEAGIIHRDLKPDNIFLLKEKAGNKDYVKIIDFGISKFQPLNNEMKMTQTGAVMGTPYYMSPEQAHGGSEVDARSDLYTVGVIMYEAVTGSVPFDAPTFNQLLFKIVLSEPPPLAQVAPELDPGFATLIQKAMARDVTARFQNAREMAAAIAAWEQTGAGVFVSPQASRASMADITGSAAAVVPGVSSPGFTASQPGTVAINPVQGTQTSGNWASSQAGVAPAKPSKAPLFAALGVAAVVVLGGGAVAAMKLGGHGAATPAASSAGVAPPAVSVAMTKPVTSAAPEAPPPAPAASSAAPAETSKPAGTSKPVEAKPATHVATHVAAKPATKPTAKPTGPSTKPAEPDFGY